MRRLLAWLHVVTTPARSPSHDLRSQRVAEEERQIADARERIDRLEMAVEHERQASLANHKVDLR